ncbi:hypothetical protein C8R48DRAFT_323295 [Suillus tomentosus]|nr:hypothetical protein C8R48DRAFT_323295 [Suillus tomentosus]
MFMLAALQLCPPSFPAVHLLSCPPTLCSFPAPCLLVVTRTDTETFILRLEVPMFQHATSRIRKEPTLSISAVQIGSISLASTPHTILQCLTCLRLTRSSVARLRIPLCLLWIIDTDFLLTQPDLPCQTISGSPI